VDAHKGPGMFALKLKRQLIGLKQRISGLVSKPAHGLDKSPWGVNL